MRGSQVWASIACWVGLVVLANAGQPDSEEAVVAKQGGAGNRYAPRLARASSYDLEASMAEDASSEPGAYGPRAYPEILWWYPLDAPSFGSAALADLDHDGRPEIAFGTYFNDETVHVLNADDGSVLWTYPTGGCNDASPAIADVDLDGDLEVILAASSPHTVYCFDGESGGIEWTRSTGSPNYLDSPPAVADVDNDGKPEVILGAWYGYVFCLNGEDGSIEWQVNVGSSSFIQSGPSILDLDEDGDLDVLVAQWAGACNIFALDGEDGSTLWECPIPQDYMYHGGSFADIDEDGKLEIAIGSYDNHVYVINSEDGSLEWSYPTTYYAGGPTSIADLDNDDHLEIVFTAYNLLGVLSHTGSLEWSYPAGGSIFRGAAIADIDADETLDVVFGSDDGILRALRGDSGGVIWAYSLQQHYGRTFEMDHAPVIADFDGDGKLDVFVVGGYGSSDPPTSNHGRAYALRAGDGTEAGWPMFRHDVCHSARYRILGDYDGDGDVDLDDHAEFPGCMSGPCEAPGFVMPLQDCLNAFNFDADADVDLQDFAGLQQGFTGG